MINAEGVSGQTSDAVLTLVSTQLSLRFTPQVLQVGNVGKLIKRLRYTTQHLKLMHA